ncbi:MAG: rane protein [Alphaproteobacteria bacterium]|jgi:YggT family protein|nr:rane protein [Alphaproteobacteria bacterium]MDF3034068.1 rane protein [Alphaproteobacteria bacterium]
MDIILVPLIRVMIMALNAYWWAIVIYVILGWLEQFNVINRYNNFVYGLHTFLFRVVEPALVPIRRLLPNMGGGVDLSPLVLILGIYLVQGILIQLAIKFPF